MLVAISPSLLPLHSGSVGVRLTSGDGLMVISTESTTASHAPAGSSVVKYNLTVPELISAAFGV